MEGLDRDRGFGAWERRLSLRKGICCSSSPLRAFSIHFTMVDMFFLYSPSLFLPNFGDVSLVGILSMSLEYVYDKQVEEQLNKYKPVSVIYVYIYL